MKKYLLLSIFMVLVYGIGLTQPSGPLLETEWEEITTPGASARGFAEKDGRMWIANDRLYYSDDEGLTWREHPDFPNNSDTSQWNVYATADRIMVVERTNAGFNSLYSEDNGDTFTPGGGASYSLYQKSANELIRFRNYSNDLLGESYLVSRTLNTGETWEQYTHASSGFYNDQEITNDAHYFSISNDTIADLIYHQEWDTTYYKLALSQDLDTTFTFDLIAPDSFGMNFFYQFWYDSGKVYLSHPDSFVVVSSDLGVNWNVLLGPEGNKVSIRQIRFSERGIYWNLESGLWISNYEDLENPEFIFTPNSNFVNSFHSGDFNLYSTRENVYLQSPTMPNPELRENGIAGKVSSFHAFGKVLWVRAGSILFRSIDEGLTWERELSPFIGYQNQTSNFTIFADFGNLLYVRYEDLIHVSTDDGITWSPITNLNSGNSVLIEKSSEGIYMYGGSEAHFSSDGLVFEQKIMPAYGILVSVEDKLYCFSINRRYVSTDQGTSWSPPEIIYGNRGSINRFHTGQLWGDNYQFDNSNVITLSNDFGKTWIDYLSINPVMVLPGNDFLVQFTDIYSDIAFAKLPSSLYVTTNIGTDWGRIEGPFSSINQYTGFSYNIPQNSFIKNEFLYGYDFGGQLYRTPIANIKAQLSDTVLIQNQISGFLYQDQNNNCTLDEDDRPLPNKVISLGERTTTTDDEGWYGLFHTSTDTLNYYTDSLRHHSHNCEYANFGSKMLNVENEDTLSIAFHPIPGIMDAGLTVWSSGIFRPSGNPKLVIRTTNHGTEPIDNQAMNVSFDPSKQAIATSNSGVLINDSTWQFSVSLAVGEEKDFNLGLELNTDLLINDTLHYQIEIPLENDAYEADNLVNLEITVLSSFDPNDKTVFPTNTPRPGETTELVYRIRFQNTGNDTAFNVTIIDTLSENLNLYSLKMLEASHDYDLQIDRENIVRWTFNNILLPDSTTNEAASHGFIYFKIETNNQLVHGDQIENLASIYFDFNDPIITNTVVTEIIDILISTEDLATLPFAVHLQPNPTSHSTQLIFELDKPEKLSVNLFNELGQPVQSVLTPQILPSGPHTIDFSLLSEPSGIYFLNIKTETEIKTVRMVKME